MGPRLSPTASAAPKSSAGSSKAAPPPRVSLGSLDAAFTSFCGRAQTDMDQKSFTKMCKDVGLMDKTFTSTDSDLIFTKCCKGQRRMNKGQFLHALAEVSAKKGKSTDEIKDQVVGGGGPLLHGTVADDVRFHDDKSTYTGTHVYGGPEAGALGTGSATQLAASGMNVAQ